MSATETTRPTLTDALVAAIEKSAAERHAKRMAEFRARQQERSSLTSREEELRMTISAGGATLAQIEELDAILKRRLTLVRMDFRHRAEDLINEINHLGFQIDGDADMEAQLQEVVTQYEQCELDAKRMFRNERVRARREIKSLKMRLAA